MAKYMKSLNIAFVGVSLALLSASAFAQSLTSDSDQFIEAVQKSDGDKATQLIQSHPNLIDARNGKGDTGLIIAIGRSDPNWTGFLLNKGADPNLPGANGDTPLIEAAKVGFDDAVTWLLSLGAKVDGTNKMGETALIIAVQQRDATMVRLLLNAGADPDKTDSAAGYSARDYATRDTRSRDILKLITDKKPKPAAK
jgi:ankyrin repeat protein